MAKGEPLQLEGASTDPGYDDTYTAAVDWGDGDADRPGADRPSHQGPPLDLGEVSPTHAYDRAGTYEVALEVDDDDWRHRAGLVRGHR